jgi:hypothetical protein
MTKLFLGTLVEAAGILVIIFRMTLLKEMAGSTRVKIGQIIGDDRVPDSLRALILIGIVLIIAGNMLLFSGLRQLRRRS